MALVLLVVLPREERNEMANLLHDLRFATRLLLKQPAFTLVTIATLALGIGANTALFSVVNAVLLRPLPYGEPDRIVRLEAESGSRLKSFSPPDFADLRNQAKTFQELVAFNEGSFAVTGEKPAQQVSGALVTHGFFDVLGVAPEAGRFFAPDEEVHGQTDVVVISHGFWLRYFGGDPQAIGRRMTIEGVDHRVIGVAPRGREYPLGAELWVPLAFTDHDLTTQRGAHYLRVLGRLKRDETLKTANTEIQGILGRLAELYPKTNKGSSARAEVLQESLVKGVRGALLILLAAVAAVLLIACTNVASLLLARATGRQRELAVRSALGASRWRLVRTLLTESLLLSVAGGGAGVLIALWLAGFFSGLDFAGIPRIEQVAVNGPVLWYALIVSLLTGLLFGAVPAFRASANQDLNAGLSQGGRSGAALGSTRTMYRVLVVGEIALSLILLTCASLLVKSFARLVDVDPGFDPRGVMKFGVSLPDATYSTPEASEAFFAELVQKVERLPGVQNAAAVFGLPMIDFNYIMSVHTLDGQRLDSEEGDSKSTQLRVVTPGYFRVMGIPVLAGRDFSDLDRYGSGNVVIVNHAAAKLLWPDTDPLGHTVEVGTSFGLGRGRAGGTVVGVVGNVRHFGLDAEAPPELYLVHRQFPQSYMAVVAKTSGDPDTLIPLAREQVAEIDRDLPTFAASAMSAVISDGLALRRLYMVLLLAFAVVGLGLACVGIYGLMAFIVAQRTQEIGVRMALGAGRLSVYRLIIGQGLLLTCFGLAIGLAGSAIASRFLQSLLFRVDSVDPTVYLAALSTMCLAAFLACFTPARRASRVDPLEALRSE